MEEVRSPLTGSVWQIEVAVGDEVRRGQDLVILESMKMEIPVTAPTDGIVREIRVAREDGVRKKDVLLIIEPR